MKNPLFVDLDGTLIKTDVLAETAVAFVGQHPLSSFRIFGWLAEGKAALKRHLADAVQLDVAALPYNNAVLARIQAAKNDGRQIYLASASDSRIVRAVADHLGCFDGWLASDGATNLSKQAKADRLATKFGAKAFDYIGNSTDDLPVWRVAATAILANASPELVRKVQREGLRCDVLPGDGARRHLRSVIKALRPHQWAKNALVFVPLVTAHLFSASALVTALLAFVAFSLCASSVYVINDVVDVQADRQHPAKKKRPFASGNLSLLEGAEMAPLLIAAAFLVAWLVSPKFTAVLACYFAICTGYTFFLKRQMLIDAVTLATLYTLRIIGGAIALQVTLSQWLLAFSMFLFLALAFVKRYCEMAMRLDAALPDPANRNYRAGDLPVIASLAASSGYSAVIVFALYLSSSAVRELYRHPDVLWLACPVLLYWVSRILMLSHRRALHDDPVLFAIKDRISLLSVGLIAVLMMVAL